MSGIRTMAQETTWTVSFLSFLLDAVGAARRRASAIAMLMRRTTRSRSICERMRVQSRFSADQRGLVPQTAI
jgi:hypothetical protein